jgi:hypothetical protein
MSSFGAFLVLSIFFMIIAIPAFTLPLAFTYEPLRMAGAMIAYYTNGTSIPFSFTKFDERTLMPRVCNLWNANSNISFIRYWMNRQCHPNDSEIHSTELFWINIFVPLELFYLAFFALSFACTSLKFPCRIKLLIFVSLLFWLSSIMVDTMAKNNYVTLNNFVHQQVYDVAGKVSYIKTNYTDSFQFASQNVFIQNFCDMFKYFPDVNYWQIQFQKCDPIVEWGTYPIIGASLKAMSLCMLLIANIILCVRKYWIKESTSTHISFE